MSKETTTVRVAGKEYALVSSDSPEQLTRVANFVDRSISETIFAARASKENAAVLVALNLADELMKAKDENARLRREMDALRQAQQ